ncbi:hypothetical protein D3C86_1875290 [compost metagenome]
MALIGCVSNILGVFIGFDSRKVQLFGLPHVLLNGKARRVVNRQVFWFREWCVIDLEVV